MAKYKWKGFIVKALVFLVLAVGFDFLVGKIYRKLELKALERSPYGMVTEYTMWKVNTDVVIIGASEALHSYIPSFLEEMSGMSVYNCGKDGCGFYYQNAMINGILDRYNPKMIIWSISPNALCSLSENERGVLSQLNQFYKDNDFCKQALKMKSKYELIKLFSNSYSFNSRLFPYLYKIFMSDYSYEKGGYAPLFDDNPNLTLKEISLRDDYDVTKRNVFAKTLERCKQSGVQVICVFTPRYEKEKECLSKLTTYQELKIVLERKDVLLIENLYHDGELMSTKYFKDNAHLNHTGAKLFNEKLFQILVDYNP